MSRYFSPLDLYHSVVNGDLESLQRGIFFLGVRIHSIKICRLMPALIFSANICKLDLVEFLLDDFLKYPFEKRKVTGLLEWRVWKDILAKVMAELGRHRTNPQYRDRIEMLIIRIRDLLFDDNGTEAALRELVKMEAFHLLGPNDVSRSKQQRRIQWLVKYCLENNKSLFSLPEDIQNDPFFREEVNKFSLLDNIQSIETQSDDPFTCEELNTHRCVLKVVVMEGDVEEIHLALQRSSNNEALISVIAEQNNVNVFQALMNDKNINRTVRSYGPDMCSQDLLRKFFKAAIDMDMSELTQTILSHKLYPLGEEDWMTLYYELISKGRIRSVAYLKHLVDFSDHEKKDHLFHTVFRKEGLDHLRSDITTEDLLEVVEQVESLTANTRPHSMWRQKLVLFPRERLRPDLVKPLRKYGLAYTEREVLDAVQMQTWISEKKLKLQLTHNRSNIIDLADRFKSMCCVFLGDSLWPGDTIISLNHFWNKHGRRYDLWHLLEVSSVETGKRVTLDDRSFRRRYDWHNWIDILESKRRKSLSLRKLCRLAVRKAIIKSCESTTGDFKIVQDSILSLYMDEHLPKTLVDYVLYRDVENRGGTSLYHRLMSFSIV